VIFENLAVWVDEVQRRGDESMAIDEWLLEFADQPILRVYRWLDDWASIGYFSEMAGACVRIPGVKVVRRWTGGGMVDHRCDWTYTIVAPQTEEVARSRGAESYERIHEALGGSLREEGILTTLSTGIERTSEDMCFKNPVGHDLIGPDQQKLAGAGQRRSMTGLLHQGSVAVGCDDKQISIQRAASFAGRLAAHWSFTEFHPEPHDIIRRVVARYGNEAWLQRR